MTRIALITGGSRGLGRASARALAGDGTDIVVTYRSNPEEANAVAAGLSGRGRTAIALPLDVTDHDSFPAFAGELRGQLRERWATEQSGILINNAGFDGLTPVRPGRRGDDRRALRRPRERAGPASCSLR